MDKTTAISLFRMVNKGKISFSNAYVFLLFKSMAHDKQPYNQLDIDQIKKLTVKLGIDPEYFNYQIRKLRNTKLISTIYEFDDGEGNTHKVNNYKAALKIGIRGLKHSYLILKNTGEL